MRVEPAFHLPPALLERGVLVVEDSDAQRLEGDVSPSEHGEADVHVRVASGDELKLRAQVRVPGRRAAHVRDALPAALREQVG